MITVGLPIHRFHISDSSNFGSKILERKLQKAKLEFIVLATFTLYLQLFMQHLHCIKYYKYESPSGSVVKNPPTSAGDTGDSGLIPGLGRSPGEGNGKPLHILASEILWTEKPDGLHSPWGCKRVRHNLTTKTTRYY